jgi:hypothetical protein
MMRKSVIVTGAAALLGLGACGDVLNVTNKNNPSVDASFSSAKGVELLVAGLGPQLNNTQRATESVNTQAKILAGESFASVANFGMAARAQIPRSIISNELGNDNQGGNMANYNNFQRYARNAAEAIRRLDLLKAEGDSLSTGNDRRAKAFAYLSIGRSLGYLSLMYDSASIITPLSAPVDPAPGSAVEPLSGAAEVNVAAIAMLDSAVLYAVGMTAMPSTWISGNALDAPAFTRLVRSYRAKFRAGVARDVTERAAVDWTAVIADATNGITADFEVSIGGSTGWSATFDVAQSYVTGGWHSVPMYYSGMADTSGNYDAWLAEDRNFRRQFLVLTPDRRWPSGNTRAAQRTGVTNNTLPTFTCLDTPSSGVCARYMRNRPDGNDVLVGYWGESMYDHRRYGAVNALNNTGDYVEMSETEVDMLAAEGYIRAGSFALAEPLINKSRTRNGLPSVVGVGAGVVPGGTGCVPRVPQPPSFITTACGTLMEAMKYEKRMETQMTGYAVWYTDSRGWGDLIGGTVVEWPVPYQEMQARQKAFYNGERRAPAASTYGF